MHNAVCGAHWLEVMSQHFSPGAQTVVPQGVGGGDGRQMLSVQAPPGGVQVPQLGLQQTSPAGQVPWPQGAPAGGHCMFTHMTPYLAHVPQPGLQQYSPGPQKDGPQGVSCGESTLTVASASTVTACANFPGSEGSI